MNGIEYITQILKQEGVEWLSCFPSNPLIEEAAKAGITAAIEPGGSLRDDEVIAAADDLGLAMIFTGNRHFRH